jgi:hypothetical protein
MVYSLIQLYNPLEYDHTSLSYEGILVISHFVADICMLEFTTGLVSQICQKKLKFANKPRSKLQNAYIGDKTRYYHVSLIPFDLLNIL